MEYQNIRKAHDILRRIIYSSIDFGDTDEDKAIDRITLGDIRAFLDGIESKVVKCDYCNGSGGFPDNEAGFKSCPKCNGDGGYFRETHIDLDLDW
jgi:hypothetical protein